MSDLFGDDETPQEKGGKARAKALPAERRREIARAAAAARWNDTELLPQVLCGSGDRPMRIPTLNLEIPCYVLEGERRVLVQRGMVTALNLSRGSSAGSGGDRLAKFVAGQKIRPYVPNDLLAVTANPIKFRAPNGSVAYGYDAEVLHQICLAVLEARRHDALQEQQKHIGERCEILISAWALAGIVSAVDEATGYQYLRSKTAIEQIIDKWLVKELQPWKKQFPADYYKRIHELNNWTFNPDSVKRPGVIGHWTNDIIYDRLGPGLREQLHDYAGRDEKGRLKHHLYQYLTGIHGIPELKSHMDGVVALMRAASNWRQFKEMLQRAFPKPQTTLSMALNDLDQMK